MIRSLCAAGLLLHLTPTSARAWGTEGHEAIVRLAVRIVGESCLAAYLRAHISPVLIDSMAPDRWKATDPAEAPRHYLNIDAAGDPGGYPRTFEEAVARFGTFEATRNGTVPWRTEELARLLEARLAQADAEGAARVAGQLGHYVGDAHSPVHATVNFDGQLTGNPGLHARWETEMPRDFRRPIEEAAAALGRLEVAHDPVNAVFDALLSGNAAMPEVVAADREGGGSTTFSYAATGALAARRWALAASLLATLWEDAWAGAGRPVLAGMPPACAPAPDAGTAPEPGPAPVRPVSVTGGGGCASAAGGAGVWTSLVALALALGLPRKKKAASARPRPS
jgi:hypothetical protein